MQHELFSGAIIITQIKSEIYTQKNKSLLIVQFKGALQQQNVMINTHKKIYVYVFRLTVKISNGCAMHVNV